MMINVRRQRQQRKTSSATTMLLLGLVGVFVAPCHGFSAVASTAAEHTPSLPRQTLCRVHPQPKPLQYPLQYQQQRPYASYRSSKVLSSSYTADHNAPSSFSTTQQRPIATTSVVAGSVVQPNPLQRIMSHPLLRRFLGSNNNMGNLGMSFALTYSVISNINGAISLSVAWYMTCLRTGLSPTLTELFKSYTLLFAVLQCLKPARLALATVMCPYSERALAWGQEQWQCSRGMAMAVHYAAGWLMALPVAMGGIVLASGLAGVRLF